MFRHVYMADQVRRCRLGRYANKTAAGGLNENLVKKMGKAQSAIARLEDPDYGRLAPQTLLELAEAFELPLLIQITDWKDWLQRMADQSKEALEKRAFDPAELLIQPYSMGPPSPSIKQSEQPAGVVSQIGAFLNSSRGTFEQAFVSPFASTVLAVQLPSMPFGNLDDLNFGQSTKQQGAG